MYMPTLKRRWTVDDLDDLPEDGNRYEVIDGELFVTPAPSLAHQRAIGLLYFQLYAYLSRERIGDVVFAPADVIFSRTRGVQPDLLVMPLVNGKRPTHFQDAGRLLLAVEVLSPSTARSDRVAKRTLFRNEGVPEYWIVDMDSRTIERSTPSDARVDVVAERLAWPVEGASEQFEMDVADYFAQVLDD
jgi:Uma2 family endonuclease